MIQFNDIFKPQTEKERVEAERKANEAIDLTGDMARNCLATDQFKVYRDNYEKAEKKIVLAMLKCTQCYLANQFDFQSYGNQMLVYMTRMKDLRSLLDIVEADARKGKDKDAKR